MIIEQKKNGQQVPNFMISQETELQISFFNRQHLNMNRSHFFATLLAVGLAAGHFLFLFKHCPPSFLGPDANGYFVQAALLAKNGRTALEPESPLTYIGNHWLETTDGRFFSRYPPGFGILIAIPYAVFGPETGLYLTPLLASLTVLLLFLLCRPHVGGWFALGAMVVFAVHPTANLQALNWGAHTAVTFFLLAGLWLLGSWARSPATWKAALAGLMLGVIPTLRYAEVVAGIGIAVFMVYHVAVVRRERWHDLIAAFTAAAVPVGLLLWRNAWVFGAPFNTGYALTNEQQWGSGFSFAFFAVKWRGTVEMLMGPGMGFFFALGVAGLVTLCARKITRGLGILLVGVIVSISLVYTAYYVGRGSVGGLRFLLPTLPLYLLSACCLVREYGRSRAVLAGFVFLILVQTGLWLPETIDRTAQRARNLERTAMASRFVRDKVPSGAVVIADRRLQENLMYYPGLKLVDAELIRSATRESRRGRRSRGDRHHGHGVRPQGADHEGDGNTHGNDRPRRANPRQSGKASRLRAHYDIEDAEKRASLITLDLYELSGNPPELYWIGRKRDMHRLERLLDENDRFVKIGEIDLLREPGGEARRGRVDRRRTGGGHFGSMSGTTLELFKLEKKKRGG
jgi:hypothetical protein